MSARADYFPVQRIAQACLQCRRKKCRCTGDKPTCGHCRRLGIKCVYRDEPIRHRPSRPRVDQRSESPPENISGTELILRHLSAMEEKLDALGSRLSNVERYIQSPKASDQSLGAHGQARNESSGEPLTVASNQDDSIDLERQGTSLLDDGTPADVISAVVDAYFSFCQNQPYSFFHEEGFRSRWAEQKVPAHLLLTILATAARFCTHPYFSGRAYEMSVEYATRAWKLVVSDCFTASKVTEVSTVQTVALLGLFDFTAGRSRHGSAWVKVGMAVRMAQDCGLMLETASHLPYVEQEERRRVFWSVYLLDRLVSCGRGRPPAIVDASCHVQLPCEETMWKNGLWNKTQSLDEITDRTLPIPKRQASFAQVIAISQILGRSAQYMLQEFNIRSPHPPWDPSSDFAALEADLLHFETYLEMHRSLEDVLAPHISSEGVVDYHNTGPILFSRAYYHLCYCLLNHPFLLRRRIDACRSPAPVSFIKRSFDLGWQHARQLIELIRQARERGCSFHASSSGYCFIVAGSIISLRTYDENQAEKANAQSLLHETLEYLDLLGQHWNNVASMAVVLRRMVEITSLGSALCSKKPQQQVDLTPAEEETMWAAVDYNTMSGDVSSDTVGDGQASIDIWPDSWLDLFGGIDYQFTASFDTDMGSHA